MTSFYQRINQFIEGYCLQSGKLNSPVFNGCVGIEKGVNREEGGKVGMVWRKLGRKETVDRERSLKDYYSDSIA